MGKQKNQMFDLIIKRKLYCTADDLLPHHKTSDNLSKKIHAGFNIHVKEDFVVLTYVSHWTVRNAEKKLLSAKMKMIKIMS